MEEVDEIRSLLQVYVINVEATSSCCSENVWHDYPIRMGNNRTWVIFAVPPKWQLSTDHRKCAIDIYILVHAAENFLRVFIRFFLWMAFATGIEGSTLPLCNNTAMHGRVCEQSLFRRTIPDVHCCHQNFHVLKNTEFTFCCEELLEVFFCQERNAVTFTASFRRQQFCFIIRQVRKFFVRGHVWISRDYVQEKFRIS
jgi:hypothetical protein